MKQQLLGANGLPLNKPRNMQDVLLSALSSHEARINALAAQQVHLAILIEYLNSEITKALPDFELDEEEFQKFRDIRFKEMQAEAEALNKAREQAAAVSKIIQEQGIPIELDLDEINDMEKPTDE